MTENWWEYYLPFDGEVRPVRGGSKPHGAFALVRLLVESDNQEYLKFTQCRILDANGAPVILTDAQKHEGRKFFSTAYDTELHWQRAPRSVTDLFLPSETRGCGNTHDWDGCTCKRCGAARAHEWGDVVEFDMSALGGALGVFDSTGVIKSEFIKTCKNCKKEETVRTVYK